MAVITGKSAGPVAMKGSTVYSSAGAGRASAARRRPAAAKAYRKIIKAGPKKPAGAY